MTGGGVSSWPSHYFSLEDECCVGWILWEPAHEEEGRSHCVLPPCCELSGSPKDKGAGCLVHAVARARDGGALKRCGLVAGG